MISSIGNFHISFCIFKTVNSRIQSIRTKVKILLDRFRILLQVSLASVS